MEERYKDFKLGCSQITGEIFLGKLNRARTKWLDGRRGITEEAVNAVFEHLKNKKIYYTDTVDGIDCHMIVISDAEKELIKNYRKKQAKEED